MEMEELNKSQIVLLTLLVSFVTSLATGIVTVSLMEQGVSPVTTTVNKIVERTKEIVIKETQDPIIVTETETVVVHPSDLVASAVAKNKNSSIIIYKVADSTTVGEVPVDTTEGGLITEEEEVAPTEDQIASAVIAVVGEDTVVAELPKDKLMFTSRGVVLKGGIIIADASVVSIESSYVVLGPDGERVVATLQGMYEGIAIFSTNIGMAATIGDVSKLKRGQAMIVLSGSDRFKVITTVVSDIIVNDSGIAVIEIDKAMSTPGSMLINMDGELIGMSTGASRTNGNTWFTPSNRIEAALESHYNTDS